MQVLTSLSSIGIKAVNASEPQPQQGQADQDSASPGNNAEGPSDSLIADASITLRTLEREVLSQMERAVLPLVKRDALPLMERVVPRILLPPATSRAACFNEVSLERHM